MNSTSITPKREPSAAEALFLRASAGDLMFRSHGLRVAALSVCIGTAFGLRPRELETLELAAKLHDVGKLAVPRSILAKCGPLDDDEWAAVRIHPAEGARLLAPFVPSDVLTIIRSHHERWDGTGYPDKLQGPAIPMMARIVSVADAFHALITDRPYRPRFTVAKALEILAAGSGTQWDTRLCAAFASSSLPQRIAGVQEDSAKIA